MKLWRILINDRNYTSWKFHEFDTNKEVNVEDYPFLKNVNPIDSNLFSRDLINDEGIIQYSHTRQCQNITGILLLENNKTYGRTENKKRLLYKCIPDDKHMPVFLVPYDIKLGFSKQQKNKYVLFKFNDWSQKHPQGIITEVLGDVDNLEAFYEYQLYCRSLHESISDFIKTARKVLGKKNTDEYIQKILKNPNYIIDDRRDEYIMTIDPENSMDLDDGLSINKTEEGWRVSIYIANVFFWMETFDLWSSFSKRVSTIYLPDKRRPMLPTVLSESLCSLQENKERFSFSLDIYMNNDGNVLKDSNGKDRISFQNALIRVKKNYKYEDHAMIMGDKKYQDLYDLSQKLDKNILDSHDVVAFWMVQMNIYCGRLMSENKFGIFRTTIHKPVNVDENIELSSDIKRVIKTWSNFSGQYVLYSEGALLEHELMQQKTYVHITSPIRRIVDTLNQMLFFINTGSVKKLSNSGEIFLNDWLKQIEYINTSMRSIRKVQNDCELMHRCFTNPEIMMETYDGIVFDKINKNDGLITYMVYLEKLKLLSRITTYTDVENLSLNKFKLFTFSDEYNAKKKIRLHIIN